MAVKVWAVMWTPEYYFHIHSLWTTEAAAIEEMEKLKAVDARRLYDFDVEEMELND